MSVSCSQDLGSYIPASSPVAVIKYSDKSNVYRKRACSAYSSRLEPMTGEVKAGA